MKSFFKKAVIGLVGFSLAFSLSGCGGKNKEIEKPNATMVQEGISQSLKDDAHIDFDRISDFEYQEVEVTEDDMTQLKSIFASKVEYVKYEATFSIVSVEMDMTGNYSAVFVYNAGEWRLSFGYITDKDNWTYQEKEASRVDKQRMLRDLQEEEFGTFNKGYVGDIKYSSIKAIEDRTYDETIHRDVIKTSVAVKTDFAEYTIPITMTYYFSKGTWDCGGVEIADIEDWTLEYNQGAAPEFLSDNIILSYLTTETNFLTYVCNLEYVSDYSITKESEVASKESVAVNYVFTVKYENIGSVSYNVELLYEWLNNEWSEPEPTPSVKSADFSEMLNKNWSNDNGSYFKFTSIEENEDKTYKLSGQYSTNGAVDLIANLNVPLRDNNWNANITDINGNQIWDIPSSSFDLNLQYGAIVYDDKYFAPVQINIVDDNPETQETTPTSNVLVFDKNTMSFENEITKDGLKVNGINIGYENDTFTLNGTITNISDGQSNYTVSIALFDENDMIIAEGVTSSGDTQLMPDSGAAIKININDLVADDYSKINKIIIYIKNS